MKKYSILGIIAAAVVLGSCSNDDAVVNESGMLKGINVTIEAADFAALTRSTYVVDPSRGFVSSWSEGDVIGIYPLGGDQVAFPISEGEGSSTARFDGGSWALRSNVKYSAYYPFSKSNYMVAETAIPVTYTGQAQSGNDNTAGLAAYDYLAAAATQPNSNGTVDLSMKHLGSFVRFQLTMPKAATLVNANVASDGTTFVTTGTVDLSIATPTITSVTTVASYDITLSNITCAKDEVVKLYTMMAPANFSSSKFTITLTDSEGKTYIYECTGSNQHASKSYNYTITETSGGTGATIEDAGWGNTDGHDWVDLGLPSGTKWATCNVGASSPSESGSRFAWGETVGTSEGKRNFSWETYKWCNGSSSTITKYCTDAAYGIVDNVKMLSSADDAATANWGEKWRMPTKTEQDELRNNCYWVWTTSYNGTGVAGCIIYKAKEIADRGKFVSSTQTASINYSLSDCHIFLRAAGTYLNSSLRDSGSNGYYWSSTLSSGESCGANLMNFSSSQKGYSSGTFRYFGNSIRAVFK